MNLTVAAWIGLLACGTKEESAGEPTPPAPVPSSSVTCENTAPSLDGLVITDNGFFQCEQESWPSILLTAEVSDVDGDLTYYTYRLWWDTTLDGSVDTSGAGVEVFERLDDGECTLTSATVGMILCITGNPPYETDVEFGAIVYDEAGNASNGGAPFVATYRTPDSNGNY